MTNLIKEKLRTFFTPNDVAAGPKTIHFLHIGKAAGTQINHLSKQINAAQSQWHIEKHPHRVNRRDLPPKDPYFFSIREPVGRFFSGFYSRKRKGQPRLLVEWTGHEKRAFAAFEHANDLAEALFEDGPRGHMAFCAINAISHTSKAQIDWFECRGFFFELRPPLWIIRQEHLEDDWAQFLAQIDVSPVAQATQSNRLAHRNNYADTPPLSDLARANLARWYVQDIEFYKQCEAWITQQKS